MGRSGAKHTHVSYPAFQRDLYLGNAVVSVLFTKLVPPTPTIRQAHTERGPAPGNGRAVYFPGGVQVRSNPIARLQKLQLCDSTAVLV